MVEGRSLLLTQSVARPRARQTVSLPALAWRQVRFLLRLSLAVVFFWFGLLKIANVSPVIDLIHNSIPFLAASPYIELLGLGEIMIAIGLVIDRLSSYAAFLM